MVIFYLPDDKDVRSSLLPAPVFRSVRQALVFVQSLVDTDTLLTAEGETERSPEAERGRKREAG